MNSAGLWAIILITGISACTFTSTDANKSNSESSYFQFRESSPISDKAKHIIEDYIRTCIDHEICILYLTDFNGDTTRFQLFGLPPFDANLLIPQSRYGIQPTGFIRLLNQPVFIYTHFDRLMESPDKTIWEKSGIWEEESIIKICNPEGDSIISEEYYDYPGAREQWQLIITTDSVYVIRDVKWEPLFPSYPGVTDTPIIFVPPSWEFNDDKI